MQNKLHYAVTHHTAAEIVYGRADSTKPNMGLTTWKNAPKGRIRDVYKRQPLVRSLSVNLKLLAASRCNPSKAHSRMPSTCLLYTSRCV